MTPVESMKIGSKILAELLVPLGFHFSVKRSGFGAGGEFAEAEFRNGERVLELHFRSTLGLVRYHCGGAEVSHRGYMNQIGCIRDCQYPGYGDEPIDGFRRLKHDLADFADDFTRGTCFILRRAAQIEKELSDIDDKERMAGYVGDERVRKEAKKLFSEKRYRECVKAYESIKYPELLSPSENKIWTIAKRKSESS